MCVCVCVCVCHLSVSFKLICVFLGAHTTESYTWPIRKEKNRDFPFIQNVSPSSIMFCEHNNVYLTCKFNVFVNNVC